MQNVMTVSTPMSDAFISATAAGAASRPVQTMPLSFQKDGAVVEVVKVRGDHEIHHHLHNLGFIEGAKVRVVSEQGGNLIVEVKGARIAIDKTAASKIMTR